MDFSDDCVLLSKTRKINKAEEGFSRWVRESSPRHYTFKISSFSLILETSEDGWDSGIFEVDGYKWKMAIYPNGNMKIGVQDHISLYLVMEDTYSLSKDWEVEVIFRFFLYDQILDNYMVLQEVFVLNKCIPRKSECLSRIKDPVAQKYTWKIGDFSKLNDDCHFSAPFTAGGYKWQIQFYPKGNGDGKGTNLSIFLSFDKSVTLAPDERVYVDFNLRIVDQIQSGHVHLQDQTWMTSLITEWGFHEFLLLSEFSNKTKGFLVNDCCIIEAEVKVLGVVE